MILFMLKLIFLITHWTGSYFLWKTGVTRIVYLLRFQEHDNPRKIPVFEKNGADPAIVRFYVIPTAHRASRMITEGKEITKHFALLVLSFRDFEI